MTGTEAILLDRMARRYGTTPLELLLMTPYEFDLCFSVFTAGLKADGLEPTAQAIAAGLGLTKGK